MKSLSFLLILIIPFFASGQELTIKPDWKPGEVYRFKLSFTIDAPQLESTPVKQSTVYIYNSLKVVDETREHWLLALQYDSIQLNELKLDYAARRRLGKALKSYNMQLAKNEAELTIENFEQIVGDFLDVLTGKSRDDKYRKMKAEMLESGGLEYFLDSDYDFLFKNYLKTFSLNETTEKDSLDPIWKRESREKMQMTDSNNLEYVLLEKYEKSARRDTIKNYINVWNPVFITLNQSVEYRENHIPLRSHKVMFIEDYGLEYYNTETGYERKLGKGTITETINVELID